MKRKSAARRAAERFQSLGNLGDQELATDLLREDRERVRMQRAILSWYSHKHAGVQDLMRIAQRLSKHKSERGT